MWRVTCRCEDCSRMSPVIYLNFDAFTWATIWVTALREFWAIRSCLCRSMQMYRTVKTSDKSDAPPPGWISVCIPWISIWWKSSILDPMLFLGTCLMNTCFRDVLSSYPHPCSCEVFFAHDSLESVNTIVHNCSSSCNMTNHMTGLELPFRFTFLLRHALLILNMRIIQCSVYYYHSGGCTLINFFGGMPMLNRLLEAGDPQLLMTS